MDGFNNRFNQTELEHGTVPVKLQKLGNDVATILFYVSIGCCVLVVLGYAFIRYFDRSHDRLTLRLLVYASIAHIVLGIAGVFRIDSDIWLNNDACQTIMFFYVFSNVFTVISITCIAVNLQIVFVHGIRRKLHLERWYLVVSFTVAFIIAIIPVFPRVEGYKYNDNLRDCWYLESENHVTTLWAFIGLYLWILLSILYCFIALIMVLWKMSVEELKINEHLRSQTAGRKSNGRRKWLYRWPWSLFFRPPQADPVQAAVQYHHQPSEDTTVNVDINDGNDGSGGSNESEQQQVVSHQQHHHWSVRPRYIRDAVSSGAQHTVRTLHLLRAQQLKMSYVAKVAGRVIWFPIILVLTRIWGAIGFLIAYTKGTVNPFMLLMSYVSVPMQGIFLLFIFVFDPSLHHAIRTALGRDEESHYGGGENPLTDAGKLSPFAHQQAHHPQQSPGSTLSAQRPRLEVIRSRSGLSLSFGDLSIHTRGSSSMSRTSGSTSTGSILDNATPSLIAPSPSSSWQQRQQQQEDSSSTDQRQDQQSSNNVQQQKHPLPSRHNDSIDPRSSASNRYNDNNNNNKRLSAASATVTISDRFKNNNNGTNHNRSPHSANAVLLSPLRPSAHPNRRDRRNCFRTHYSDPSMSGRTITDGAFRPGSNNNNNNNDGASSSTSNNPNLSNHNSIHDEKCLLRQL